MSDQLETEKLSQLLWKRGYFYLHWCEACKCGHSYVVDPDRSPDNRPNWRFNGDIEKPSFTPSMLIYTPIRDKLGKKWVQGPTRCHYYVTDGEIRYQGDCPHELSGKTLPLKAIPDDYGF